jgi:hypothetical protein
VNHRGEIENLLYAYQERLDVGDLEGVAELFEHAVVRGAGSNFVMNGSGDVLALFRQIFRIYDDGLPHTTHTTMNPIIHVDEPAGTATCRSVYVVYQATPELPLQPVVTGTYHDAFELVDGAWRFTERVYGVTLQGDLHAHQHLENHPTFGNS